MVAELDGGEFWLPAEFFNDDYNTEESATETDSDAEHRNGELIRRLAHSFLHENCGFSAYTSKVPATESRIWPVLSREGRKLPMPSPATSPAERQREWDFIYAAAWEVMRIRQMEQKFKGRRIHSPHDKSSSAAEIPFTRFRSIQSLRHQQLQLYQMKRQQLIKQQLTAAWNTSTQLPRTGMKSVQLDVGGNRRPSAGTGVFLPKREDIPIDALKKPASFAVLPARISQTLKLNRVETVLHPPCPDPSVADYELAPNKCHQQQYHHFRTPATSPPPAVTSPDVLLPTEWTY